MNFDASFSATLHRSGTGVIIRDDQGHIQAGTMEAHQHVVNPSAAEAIACTVGIKLALDRGYRDVIIEGDALTVIKILRDSDEDRSLTGHLLVEARTLVQQFRRVEIKHAYREANTLAHQVARKALHIPAPVLWFEEPPDFISNYRV